MKYILIVVLSMGLILMSGKIDINLEHHLNLPVELGLHNTIQTTKFFSNKCLGFFCTQYDIYLKTSLMRNYDISDLETTVFNTAGKGDRIMFHLTGVGGAVDIYARLIDLVHTTKAHTTMLVEGPVYSGHAYLALSGNDLQILPFSFIMLHTGSSYGMDCSKQTGTDRTVSKIEHCQRFIATENWLTTKLINSLPIITNDEKEQILTGHSVYITSEDVLNRTKMQVNK